MSFSRGDCIDANLAATFLEGALPEAEASAIRDHLDECDECCELLAMAAHETPGEAAAPTPARLSRVRIGADLPTASVGGVDTILDRNARPTRWLLAPGQRVDHFRVVRPIGRGGMSEVYLARDLSLGRRVALKVLHVQAATSAGVERLLAEARAIARFNHPNIVTIYGAGEQGTLPYVALEYVQGSSLGLRLRQGPLGHVEALRVGMAIAQALAEAHAHDILHRDLKPDNVMLARDGRVRVVDFGLAQVRPSAAADGAEVDHDGDAPRRHVAGTPPYMAPELLRTDRVGPGVDIWAFGVVMLEMLGAPRPYEGCDWSERSAKLRDIRPVPLPPELDRLPVELRRLVASCLDKDVEKRPDARKLAQALGRALQSGLAAEALPLAPFLGLRAFRERDQALFFGRADEIAECVERLARQALLPLVGPSGAGKSSLVHAGVVPRLREQEPWQLVTMTPTASPIATLAAALFAAAREVQSHAPPSHGELSGPRGRSLLGTVGGQLPAVAREQLGRWLRETPTLLGLWLDELASAAGESVLLVVDQLEEVVTLCEDGDERRAFIDAVCLAAEDVAEPVRVIVTLREEFLSRLAAGSAATRALGAALIVRPPDAAALELTLTRPLSLFGFAFEDPDLPRRMVAEIGGALACLPLLSFTAELLWDRRDLEAHELPTAAYQEIGGVVGALAHHAEGVIAALDDSERRLARELLLKLVTAEGTRRRVARAELLSGLETVDDSSSSGAEQVLARLLEARLLVAVSDEDEQQVIELMHESLAVQWARLRRWIADGREDLRLFDDATQAAALWRRQGEPSSQLWSGDALARVAALLEARGSKVGAPAADEEHVSRGLRAFVAASIARERSQRVRRAALVSVTIAASLAIAIVSVVVALTIADKERQAQRERRVAEGQRQAARREGAWGAWARGARVEAAAKVRQALEAADSPALRFLWWRLRRDALRWTALRNIPRAVARSPDGRHIAVGSGSGAIYLLDARTGGLVKVLRGHPEQILFLRYAFDGQLVSGDWRGQVRSWFPPRLLLERKLRYASGALIGAQLITATFGREVHVWRVPKTGRATLVKRLPESKNSYEIAVSPDGKLLAAAGIDKKARLWRLPEATPIAGALLHESAVRDVKWVSRERLLTTTVRGHVRVFAISRAPGAPETPLAPKLVLAFETGQAWPHAVVIARRQLVATSGRRGRIALWSLRDGKRVAWLDRRSNAPSAGLMASPDGTRLYGSDRDRGVRAFDIRAPIRGQRWRPHARMLTNAAFSADGKRIATTSYDKTVRIWSAARGEVQHVLELPAGARVVSFSPDGQRIIAGARDGRIRVWRIGESRVRSFGGHEQDVMALGVARDRSVFVSGGRDRKLLLWRFDGAGGVRATNLGKHDRRVFSLAISRDKRLIASGGVGGTVRLWPLPAASAKAAPTASRVVLRGGTAAYGLDFTPAGELAISLTSREVLLLDPRRAGATPRRLGRFAGRTYSLQLDPDGKRLALPGSDHVLRLMRLADGKTRALYGHRDEINVARFDDRGRVVVSVSDDSTVRLWDAQSGAPKWFGAGLLGSPPRLLSHHGWRTLSPHGAGETAEPGRAFAAAFDGARGAVRTFDQGSGAAGALCVVRRDGRVERWRPHAPHAELEVVIKAHVTRLVSTVRGCAVLAAGAVRVLAPGSAPLELVGRGARAIGAARAGRALWIVRGEGVEVVDLSRQGRPAQRRRPIALGLGVSCVMPRGDDKLVVGFGDGSVELRSARDGRRLGNVGSQRPTVSAVERLLAGPHNTLVTGYADGTVALWDIDSGRQLASARLHGPVVYLRVQRQRVYVATELGDSLVWDLGVLSRSYCELMAEIWREVPFAWRADRPFRLGPPAKHRCAPGARRAR